MTDTGDDESLIAEPGEAPLDDREVPNAASPAAVRKARNKQAYDRFAAETFWRATLADPVGRSELYRLLREAGTFEERFACGPNGFPQPEATWFQAGQQAFGMRLFQSLIVIARDDVFRMMDEHDPRFKKPAPLRKASDE